MVQNTGLAEKSGNEVGKMNRTNLTGNDIIFGVVFMILGGCIGWQMKSQENQSRYLIAQAERHEAEKRYFDKKIDLMIEENKQIYNTTRKGNTNGTKKN